MINATLCRTSLVHIVGSMVLCKLWISLSCAWPPIRLHGDAFDSHWLFERVPFEVMDAAADLSGMLSFVMEHVCQTCHRASWVDFRWGLSTKRRIMERFRSNSVATQGTTHSNASSEVRSQGQHTTQVFPIPCDCCNMNRLLARNELDLVGGSDIGIGRHAEIHEPFFVPHERWSKLDASGWH